MERKKRVITALNKLLLILVFCGLLGLNGNSQYYWEWARSGETNSEATGTDLVFNPADGGQTLAGNYRGDDLTFQPAGFATFPNPGSNPDSYVIHFDASNTPIYAFYIGRTGNDCVISDLVHGPDGTLYVTGYFNGTADLGGTEGAGTILSSGFDLIAGFIAAYDAAGVLLWAQKLASEQVRVPHCIAIDGTKVYVGGYWSNSSLFDVVFGNPGDQGFIARYDVAGNTASLAWEHGIESWDDDQVLDLTLDASNLYITAIYDNDVEISTVNIIAGESSLSNAGQRDAMVASFAQSNGALNWSTPIQGPENEQLKTITEKDGFLYVGGVIENNTDFPGYGTLSDLVADQLCVAKINAVNGNVVWAFSEGGANSGSNQVSDLTITSDDQVVITGWYEGFAEFSGVAPNKITTVSRQIDPFIASYNTDGSLNWLRYVSPSPSNDFAYSVSSDASNSIFITGSYNFGAADTDIAIDGVDMTTGSGGNSNVFIGKLLRDTGTSPECAAGGNTDFPAGSWIIPMDNDNQPGKVYSDEPPYYPDAGVGPGGTTPFNLHAYGLVNALLQNEIPVYWVIKEGKAKDEADIEAEAFEVYPAEDANSASKAFVSGPFVIHQQYVELARSVVEAFGNEVHLFETTTDNTLPVRHKLTFKPNIVLFNNGGIKGAEWQYEKFEKLLLMAGFTADHYAIASAEDLSLGLASCVTFCAEAHWKDGEDATTTPYSTEATVRVKQFVLGGGNFLAQCAGIEAYENYQFFHTTEGMISEGDAYYSDAQKAQAHTELLPDDPFYQIHGPLDSDPTGTFVGIGISSGGYKYFVRPGISKVNNDQVAGSIKLTPENEEGGYVFYLGGHDYRKRKSESKPYDPAFVNGIRMFLNAIFIPPSRPSACPDLSFCSNLAPCSTTISYPASEFCRTDADPIPTITGEAGGTYTEGTGSVIFVSDATGEIDLSASARGPYTITYTSPSGCVATFDIHNYAPPSTADAGPDQAFCVGPDAILNAVPPTTGTGQWSVITGSASITDPSDPSSTVTDLSPGMNTFRWTITNGPCEESRNNVNIYVDNVNPVVACLINQNKNANASCEYIMQDVTGTAAVFEPCSYAVTQSIPVGTALPIGVHPVTITATDEAGNIGTCTTNLIVQDTTTPWFDTCPGDITVNNDADQCGAVVSWVGPTADDNCIYVLTQISGPANGDLFPVGTSTITYEAEDLAGNVATCAFNVIVTDDQAPEFIDCPADMFVNTHAGSCDAIVTWAVPTVTDNCNANVIQTGGLGNGSAFLVGIHTIEYTATDLAGNSTVCSFTITVTDTEAPQINNCPADIFVNTDVGSCDAIVTWAVPTVTDNCNANVIQTGGLGNGSAFLVGIHTIEYTATDLAGNSTVCSFTITVTDTEAPQINNCPADIFVNTDAGSCDAVVNWTEPTASDNCIVALAQSSGPSNGSSLAIGSYTIEYVASDQAGNSTSCEFMITVSDNQAVVIINCPSNISAIADTGTCGTVISWDEPSAMDNCPGSSIVQVIGPASGTFFPVGTTTVSYIASDAGGASTDCTFTVLVEDQEAPEIGGTPDDIQIEALANCGAFYSWDDPTATDNCTLASLTQTEGPSNGGEFPLGLTTVTFEATDLAGNTAQSSFVVEVVDSSPPVFDDCPENMTVSTDPNSCGAQVNWDEPSVSDACGMVVVDQTGGDPSGSYFEVGTHIITYEAEDDFGNTSVCSFEITVIDNEAPEFTSCPNDILIAEGQSANWIEPEASDNCGTPVVNQTEGLLNGSLFPLGTSLVEYEASDAQGNIATCSFNVIVNDTEPPVFVNCPEDALVPSDPGSCTAVFSWENPTIEQNDLETTVIQTEGPPSGSEFAIGITVIEFIATDLAGNVSVCSFTVTVEDDMAPSINACPFDLNLFSDTDNCGTTISWIEPTAEDHCSDVELAQVEGPANGTFQEPGTYEVVYYAVDTVGNESWCSFEITVTDNTPPVFEVCAEDISMTSDSGECGAIVTWDEPMVSDNCGVNSLTQVAGLANGEFFPSGLTEVVYEATDDQGNTSICSFQVEIVDNEPPQLLTGPEDMIVGVSTSYCSAMVVWLEPTGYDNCSEVTVEQTIGLYSGSNFQLGENEVVYTFTDEAGNTAEWGFTITVIDDIEPTVLSCPVSIVTCDPVVNWEEPEASDTCSSVEIVQLEGLPSGSIFPIGIQDIVYAISDESGNITTCSFTIEVLPEPDANWGSPGTLCSNMRPLDLSDFILGDDGGVFQGDGINGNMFDPGLASLGVNMITYSISNEACTDSITEMIEVVEAIELISGSETEFCGLLGHLRVSVSSGQGIWIGPEGVVFDPSPMANDVTVTAAEYGVHTFTYMIEGSEFCGAELSLDLTFYEEPSIAIAGNDQVLFAEYDTQLEANEPEVGEGSWDLFLGNGVVHNEFDPKTPVSQLSLGDNMFIWEVSNGVCPEERDTLVVFVQDLIFPSGISPNNDGDNDVLEIKGLEGMQNSITIFDRWGKRIYEADNYQNDWGGTTRKGKPLPEDTYFYVIETPIKQFSGYLVIKR